MTTIRQRITPFLWFDDQAEEAAAFYCSIFDDSRITSVSRHTRESAQTTGKLEGSAMIVEFRISGLEFTALNGGPCFQFNEAVSLVAHCASQEEVDRYWSRLCEGADPDAQQCGWLKDRFGLSWQVVPEEMIALISDPDPERSRRVMAEVMKMKKIDLESLRRAADGGDG